VTQVAGASLQLTFQNPTSTLQSLTASSTEGTKYDKEVIAAADTAATASIDGSSLRLPSYLLRLAGRNDFSVNLSNVLDEAAELGDSGDSYVEGNDAHEHDVALNVSLLDRMSLLEETNAVEDTDDNCDVLARGGVLSVAAAVEIHVNIKDMPTDWEPLSQKTEQGEPKFAAVENPGGWSQYVFCPDFGTTAPR
jgi:hypothetical protein